MVKVKTLANAMAVVVGVGFIVCRILSIIMPNVLLIIAQSWFHTFDLTGSSGEMSTSLFVIGLISSMVVAWIGTYAVAALYVKLAK